MIKLMKLDPTKQLLFCTRILMIICSIMVVYIIRNYVNLYNIINDWSEKLKRAHSQKGDGLWIEI
jgi:hypothetical protein